MGRVTVIDSIVTQSNRDLFQWIAAKIGGTAHHTGGNVWVAILENADGSITVAHEEGVSTWASRQAWDQGEAADDGTI